MNSTVTHQDRFATVEIDLKNPVVAGVLAWLWPGAGHLYQGRTGKGLLYMICILVTYFWGLAMGDGHVVYASFRKPDIRYPFILQIGVGLPAFPAVIQKMAADDGHLLFGSDFMAPPQGEIDEQKHDQLAKWHEQLGFYFELGTLYTMIAGLLNMLVIYDASMGPVFADPKAPSGSRASTGDDQPKN
jgi:TM2 domain-containing membrane protein YozV